MNAIFKALYYGVFVKSNRYLQLQLDDMLFVFLIAKRELPFLLAKLLKSGFLFILFKSIDKHLAFSQIHDIIYLALTVTQNKIISRRITEMRRYQKVLCIFLATVLMLAAFSGCTGQDDADTPATQASEQTSPPATNDEADNVVETMNPEDIRIFVEHFSNTIEVAMQWRYGAMRAGEELGIHVSVNGAEDATAERNIAIIEQAIAQGYHGIASIALVSDAYAPVYNRATELGIPVMTYHMDAPESMRVAYFGPNQESYARAAARFMAGELGMEGQVITLQGTPSDTETLKVDMFVDELTSYAPDIEVVVRINDTLDPAGSFERISAALTAHPDAVGFFSATSRGGSDVVTVTESMGITPVSVVTMDLISYNVELLREGRITGIVDQGALTSGYLAVMALFEQLTQGELTNFHLGANYLPDVIVTLETLPQFEDQLEAVSEMMQ